eukprot:scaffold754_cov133-Skeletonema_dohrnii-CCMP3373.AAC.8
MGFLVVYCGEDQADLPAPTPLVTNFNIDADGDVLTLYKADLLVDLVRFGRMFKGMSRGRALDGSPDWVEKYEPSPCGSNGMLGDLNEDGIVGQADVEALQAVFGQICHCPCAEDLNGDGTVNTSDLLILLGAFNE